MSGFYQVRNTPRAKRILAVLTASGCYLPECLPFGPMNGPEDFARVVDTLFAMGKSRIRRLNREWQVYVDDFCVRTGRWRGGKAYSDADHDRDIAAASAQGQAQRPAAAEARGRLAKLARRSTDGEVAAKGPGPSSTGCDAGDGPERESDSDGPCPRARLIPGDLQEASDDTLMRDIPPAFVCSPTLSWEAGKAGSLPVRQ